MKQALEGVRVLDFTQMMLGPYATQLLGDLGADVIKVERPVVGEWERGLEFIGGLVAGDSAAFLAMNRNKRSITVDLKSDRGRAAILKLADTSDVVAENFRPGVMKRLGLGYDDLTAVRPDVIYASGSGWGQETPYAKENRPGQDLLIQAMSGIAFNAGRRDDPPIVAGSSLCDATTALTFALGMVAALYERTRSGQGQRVEVDLFSTAISVQCQEISAMVNQGIEPSRSEAGIGQPWLSAPFGIYRTADSWLALSMTPLEQLATVVDDDSIAELDPWVDRDDVKRRLDRVFSDQTTDTWLNRLAPEGIWCSRVRTTKQAVDELRSDGSSLITTVEHPTAGTIELVGCPIGLSRTPWQLRLAPPLVGEHTRDVFSDVIEDEELESLLNDGILG